MKHRSPIYFLLSCLPIFSLVIALFLLSCIAFAQETAENTIHKSTYQAIIEDALNNIEEEKEEKPKQVTSEATIIIENSEIEAPPKEVIVEKIPLATTPPPAQKKDALDIINDVKDSIKATPFEEETIIDKVIDELEINNLNIKDALKLLALKSGLNIIFDEKITGEVSLFLSNINATDALRIIVEANSLAFKQEGKNFKVMALKEFEEKYGYPFGKDIQTRRVRLLYAEATEVLDILYQMKSSFGKVIYNDQTDVIILIDTPDKVTEMEKLIKDLDVTVETKLFSLKYISAIEAAEKVKYMLTPRLGGMQINEELNNVIVADTPVKIEQIEKLINSIDHMVKDVSVQLKAIQILLNDEYQDGVDWNAIVSKYLSLSLSSDKTRRRKQISAGILSAEDFIVLLEALETVGDSHIIVNDKLKIIENKELKLSLNPVDTFIFGDDAKRYLKNEAEQINLYLQEQFFSGDEIKFQIAADLTFSEEGGYINWQSQDKLTANSKNGSSIEVKIGDTIILGGIFKEANVKLEGPLSGLQNIKEWPVLKYAFRNQRQRMQKSEIVVFITPIITEDTKGYAE